MKRIIQLELADIDEEEIYLFYTDKTEKEIRSEVEAILEKLKTDSKYSWTYADKDIRNIAEVYKIDTIYMSVWDWYK